MSIEETYKEEIEIMDGFVRTYDDGVKAGMTESITADLEAAASRIAILEEELEFKEDRIKYWISHWRG